MAAYPRLPYEDAAWNPNQDWRRAMRILLQHSPRGTNANFHNVALLWGTSVMDLEFDQKQIATSESRSIVGVFRQSLWITCG